MNNPAQPAPPLKKTAAIRRARELVLPPHSSHPPQFVVRMPRDVRRVDSEWIEVTAKDYLEAQHIRSYAISRIALALMGLDHVPLTLADGGTIDQLMDKALERAVRGCDAVAAPSFWQVRLADARAEECAQQA